MRDRESKTRILFIGSASGGHFYPLIAIAEELRKIRPDYALYFAGPDPYDAESLRAHNIAFVRIPSGKIRRYGSFKNIFDSVKVIAGFIGALVRLFYIYPDVIMSKGGYTSVPVVLAAAFLRIPIIIHESDAVMGRANKLARRFASYTIVSYDELAKKLGDERTVLKFGIPVRNIFRQPPTPQALTRFSLDPDRPVILIIGGSQGAERINALVLDALDELLRDFSVIHQTGTAHYEIAKASALGLVRDPEIHARYHPVPFLDAESFNDAYHVASLVLSRAGSGSIYEIALHGKPSILIPIPEEISHDQRTNAYAYARTGAASVIEEGNLRDDLLRAEIDRIMQDSALYERMAEAARAFAIPDAAERAAALIVEVASTHTAHA